MATTSSVRFWPLLLAIILLAGCGGRTWVESDLGLDHAPDWVNEGTQAVSDRKGRLIQGVGVAPSMGDLALQRATADGRARAEIARILSTYIEATLDEYSQSQGESSEINVQNLLQSSTRVALAGSRILAHWQDQKSGHLYAFAELDLEAVEETLAHTESLNSGLRHYLSEQGPRHFDRLAEEGMQ